jgi:hypothetical protein
MWLSHITQNLKQHAPDASVRQDASELHKLGRGVLVVWWWQGRFFKKNTPKTILFRIFSVSLCVRFLSCFFDCGHCLKSFFVAVSRAAVAKTWSDTHTGRTGVGKGAVCERPEHSSHWSRRP